ncbi:hypothetical protein RUM43_011521 [Polyplax serrata]|uniref:Uncharacterized protein n=1 Tax=Polyplax serrata TaxID=468196 RepID=A0AAN8NYB6_POLSC
MLKSDFLLFCRLCVQQLESENFSSIFDGNKTENEISLPEKIKLCSSIEVNENDGLSPNICKRCLIKLNQTFVFRNQCILADITLRHLVRDITFNVSALKQLLNADLENCIYTPSTNASDVLNILQSGNSIKSKLHDYLENGSRANKLKTNNIEQKKGKDKKTGIRGKRQNLGNKREPYEMLNGKAAGNSDSFIEGGQDNLRCEMHRALGFYDVSKAELDVGEMNTSKCKMKPIRKLVKPKLMEVKRKGRHKKGKERKPSSYTCGYCQKVYPSEGGWRYHVHTVHNENYQPFICDLCGQSFKVKKNLEGHKNSIHFRLKLHLCDLCGRGFASRYALKVHTIWHNDQKDFACDVCGTRFRTRGKLNTHKSIHGGPKNFMCHICSRDFRWKKDFEVHVRTHTGEKPFTCSLCGKGFASVTSMRKHEKNHETDMKGKGEGSKHNKNEEKFE